MDTRSVESHNLIISNQSRLKVFYNIYKKSILFFAILFIFMPIIFVGNNNAYLCFYTFFVTAACWIFNVFHPAITSLIPLALSTIINTFGYEIMNFMNIRNILLDCFGTLIFLVAIEDSKINKRIALKILYFFGCTHYRLCFLLFFTTMFLSMGVSNTLACGLMMPIVKAVIFELEKMGILEVFETIVKEGHNEDNNVKIRTQRPTDFTVFYFLGIAYSSSIGGMVTMGSTQTNQIFKVYSESLFPLGPNIEFPQFMLLTLPGVLVLETMLYLWMNFYFLGLFRIHNYSALQCGSTQEEEQYVKTLLDIEYKKLGKLTAKEVIVCLAVILCAILQISSSAQFCNSSYHSHIQVYAPTILCTFLLFICPTNLDFLRFCRKRTGSSNPLPTSPSKPCLSWKILRNEIHWSVLLVTGGSYAMFEALKQSRMTDEFEKFLLLFGSWPSVALALVVMVFCKILTEFASNTCVAHCMLDHIARVSVSSRVNPHYLMLAATLACSLPFHTITGTPANAIVASYFNISPRRLMYAGIGPTIFSILVVWFTVAVWSKAIWTELNVFPDWATDSNLTFHYNVN